MISLDHLEKLFGEPCIFLGGLGGEGIYLIKIGKTKCVFKKHPHAGIEARMLRLLGEYLRVPKVIWSDGDMLVMEYIESDGKLDEAEAGRVLASLHRVTGERFGLDFDTTIGPHYQPNTPNASWIDFYREERVLSTARGCLERQRFDMGIMARIEKLGRRFATLLPEPTPVLLHGDIWSGNVIATKQGAAFIDPALYYGHNEVELAFILMFDTFGERFFNVYHELNPIEKGFFEERQYLYQLYPVLVHVNSFGSGYMGMLERILRRFS